MTRQRVTFVSGAWRSIGGSPVLDALGDHAARLLRSDSGQPLALVGGGGAAAPDTYWPSGATGPPRNAWFPRYRAMPRPGPGSPDMARTWRLGRVAPHGCRRPGLGSRRSCTCAGNGMRGRSGSCRSVQRVGERVLWGAVVASGLRGIGNPGSRKACRSTGRHQCGLAVSMPRRLAFASVHLGEKQTDVLSHPKLGSSSASACSKCFLASRSSSIRKKTVASSIRART